VAVDAAQVRGHQGVRDEPGRGALEAELLKACRAERGELLMGYRHARDSR